MGTFSSGGYQKENLQEWVTKIEEYQTSLIGDDVDLDATTPLGNNVQILAQVASDFDDIMESSFWSRDIDNATGVALTKICAETGTYRKDATPTSVSDVVFYGDEGTILPEGTSVKQPKKYLPTANLVYNLTEDIVITKTSARSILTTVGTLADSTAYTITVDSVDYTFTSGTDATVLEVYEGLSLLIPDATMTYDEEGLYIVVLADMNFNVSANLSVDEIGVVGDVTASIDGNISCASNTLTEIVTSGITGWYRANNPNVGVNGYGIESDIELRVRQKVELNAKSGTEYAIQKALSNLDDVSLALVESNREEIEVDSRPPHSVECIVSGGLDDSIAQAIYDTAPAGIEFYGRNDVGTATKANGNSMDVPFTRPIAKYVWVRFEREDNDEQDLPTDYISLIREAVVSYGNSNFGIGDDIIATKLMIPFYSIEGSTALSVQVAVTDTPTESFLWESNKAIIDAFEEGNFATTRIHVVTV